jgi:uncharacterized protein (TIGR02246 family)
MGSDEQEIRHVHSTWIDAVNARDLARLHTLMTDDVVFLNPGQEPVGREGFSANLSAARPQSQIVCISDLEEVVVVGEVAYTRSQDTLSITPGTDGRPKRFAGHRITIYRKQTNGRWLLARDAHTLS